MKKGVKMVLLLLLLVVLPLTACGKGDKDSTENLTEATEIETQQTEVEEVVMEEVVEEIPANQNLLTGLGTLTEEAIGKRPVAIMINNLPKALPQYGIAQADVIFEITVEGGLSRMMAVYGDYTQVPKVCSVRSCRKYFPELAEGFDAIYVCSGMSSDVKSYINTLGLTMYEGTYNTGGLFGRDQNRRKAGYSLEHTMYFDGTGLAESIANKGYRIDLESDKTDTAFLFADMNETVIPTGGTCNAVTVDFGAVTATLRYDATSNTYLKEINGKAQMDGVAGTQLAFTNVIIMETSVGSDSNGKDRTINWKGGDDSIAYYISNGAVQKIHYKKDSIESRLKFYDEEGNELAINRGKTYIAINFKNETTLE